VHRDHSQERKRADTQGLEAKRGKSASSQDRKTVRSPEAEPDRARHLTGQRQRPAEGDECE
jgi:hypothetical protein